MEHPAFAWIATEEASHASETEGVHYIVATEPADDGRRVSLAILELVPETGQTRPLYRTPEHTRDMPDLLGMREVSARLWVQSCLSAARANRKAGRYLDSASDTRLLTGH